MSPLSTKILWIDAEIQGKIRKTEYRCAMSKVAELEKAIQELTDAEYQEFRRKFLESDWKRWDQEIEADSQAGRLA
ncbi:MAG: hypothetical protein RBU29_17100, partial [bacterium]|nr:hypothetical protein [bacterium]